MWATWNKVPWASVSPLVTTVSSEEKGPANTYRSTGENPRKSVKAHAKHGPQTPSDKPFHSLPLHT